MKKKIDLFLICGLILLGVCGCGNNNDNKKDNLNEIKENIESQEDVNNNQDENDAKDDNIINKEDKKEEIKPTPPNNSSTTENDKKQETNTQSNNTQTNNSQSNSNQSNNNQPNNTQSNNDKIENVENKDYKSNIIGVWSMDSKSHIVKFTEDKMIEILTSQNYMEEYDYTIDEDYVILNGTRTRKYDLKDDTLYLGNLVYKKRDESYVPSIYYNINAFNGTWKLNSDIQKIVLENGYEKDLNEEMVITEQNTSGFRSCGGSGCKGYLVDFNNAKPELYIGYLCYELVDKNTLVQIKCHQDTIMGSGWEDQTIHNIIYKKIN